MDNKRKASSASRGGAAIDGDHPPAKRRKMPSVSPALVCPFAVTSSPLSHGASSCVVQVCCRALSGGKTDAMQKSPGQSRTGLGWLLALPLAHRDRSSIRTYSSRLAAVSSVASAAPPLRPLQQFKHMSLCMDATRPTHPAAYRRAKFRRRRAANSRHCTQ